MHSNTLNSNTPMSSANQWSRFDDQMMARAVQLAQLGEFTARPNPLVGCVITQASEIVGEGWHQKAGQAHAEVNALHQAAMRARGATCYVSLEPCAHTGKTGPCALALIQAGVSKVIAAMPDPNPLVAGKGFALLRDAGIQVECGLMHSSAEALNQGFVSRFTRNRPWLTAKLAMSLDGRTALADGSSQWITSAAARADVQKLRARQDAIITGIGTVLADNPSLTVRSDDAALSDDSHWYTKAQAIGFTQPARVLLDRKAKANLSAKIFNDDASVYWSTEQRDSAAIPTQIKAHITPLQSFSNHQALLEKLAQLGMNNVLLESGHQLAGSFLTQGLIDELIIYVAPKLMGNSAQGLFDLQVASMAATPQLALTDVRHFADDLRLTYRIKS